MKLFKINPAQQNYMGVTLQQPEGVLASKQH